MIDFGTLMKYLQANVDSSLERDHFDRQIKNICQCIFKSAEELIDPNNREYCFELFGLDIIIDENMHCWLLELNSNPSMDAANNQVLNIKLRLLGRFSYFS
jgi:D-alanine-D-alanine ligase-like ATP-grasp enzyme